MTEQRNPAPFVPMTAADRQHMLGVIGVNDVDDLFADIPAEFRNPQLGPCLRRCPSTMSSRIWATWLP